MIIPLLNKPNIPRIHFILVSAALLASLAVSQAFAGKATVTWHSNQESDLAGYNLYYGKNRGLYEKSIDVGKVAQYTLTELDDNIPYYFTVTAYDLLGNESAYSQEVSFTSIVNRCPAAPSNLLGPASGYALTAYTFETSASDPDGDDLQYQFDWGDKSQLQWGPASQSHQWQEAGSYCVKTRATDPDGALSDWSGCLNLVLEPLSYPVAASAGANGSISPVGEVSVAKGTDQTFTIRADENCHVAEVMVDNKPVGPVQSYTFTSVHASHSISAVFSPNNQLPVAEAGADQLVDRGVIVTLNGTGSRDPDDGIASYAWRQLSGIPVTLKNSKSVQATFISPPSATPDISLAFALTVTDHSGAKDEDTCAIVFTANPYEDVDQDGINDNHDNCPGIGNSEQVDKDADGVGDRCDAFKNDRNEWIDSDKDGIGDNADPDDDNDGLPDADEITTYHTDPINPDTDQDGFSDKQEILAGSDPLDGQSIPAERVAFSVYEDAEDGQIDGWEITDNDPPGAVIANVFDDMRQSRVIEFTGTGNENAFRLRNPDMTPWRNSSQFIIEWSMQFADGYVILVELNTTVGKRLLKYTPVTENGLGAGEIVRFGLGLNSDNGQWVTIIRDLKADLAKAQPDVMILEVNGLIVQGAGRIDDVKLHGDREITEDFSNRGSAGANLGHEDFFVGAYDTGFHDTGQIILQELGNRQTGGRASFKEAGGNYIDVISYANRNQKPPAPSNADGAAKTAYPIDNTDYVRVAVANNYKNDSLGLKDADIRFRIIFPYPVNYFAFSYNSPGAFEVGLGVAEGPDDTEGYLDALATLRVSADDTGFFEYKSDQVFSAVYFQTAGYDPNGSRSAGLGFGIDDVKWAVAKDPEPTIMPLLSAGQVGLVD